MIKISHRQSFNSLCIRKLAPTLDQDPHSQPSGDASAPAACRSAKKKEEGD